MNHDEIREFSEQMRELTDEEVCKIAYANLKKWESDQDDIDSDLRFIICWRTLACRDNDKI